MGLYSGTSLSGSVSVGNTIAAGDSLTSLRSTIDTSEFSEFLKVLFTGSDTDRLLALTSDTICGISLVKLKPDGTKHVTHGTLPFWASKHRQFISNLSTSPSREQPGWADGNISQLTYCLVAQKDLPDASVAFPVLVGNPFKAATYPFLSPLSLDRRQNYVIVALPVAMGTGWGVNNVAKGKPSDHLDSFMGTMHDWCLSWLNLISDYDPTAGHLILANHSSVAPADLPPLPSGCSVRADPFAEWTFIDDQDGDYADACAKNLASLARFRSSAPVQEVSCGLTAGRSRQGSPILDDDSSEDGVRKSKKARAPSKGDTRAGVFFLFAGHVESTSAGNVFKAAVFQDGMEAILRNSDVKTGAALLVAKLKEKARLHRKERDYLLRNCHVTAFDNSAAAAALLYHLKGVANNPTSWEEVVREQHGLNLLFFIPDTVALAKKREASGTQDTRSMEEMMGEHEAKLTKLSTDVLKVTKLSSLAQLQRMFSNCVLVCMTIAKYDPSTFDASNIIQPFPLLHSMAYQFSEVISSLEFEEWFIVLEEKEQAAFLYWLFWRSNDIFRKILTPDTDSVEAATAGLFSTVSPRHNLGLNNSITNVVQQISIWIENGTVEITKTALFKTSPQGRFYKAQEDSRRDGETPTAGTVPSSGHGTDATPSPKDTGAGKQADEGDSSRKKGEIICKGDKIAKPPKRRGNAKPLCIPYIRDGTICHQGNKCKFAHPPSISKWHPEYLADWKDRVKSDDNLSWNPELAPNMD